MASEIVQNLNGLLADYQIYYQNLRGFHWNIKGENFFELHVKFEELYNDTAIKIDEVAERILTLEATPLHTFQAYLDTAELDPASNVTNGKDCVLGIVSNLKHMVAKQRAIKNLAGDQGDSATEDQMSAYIEEQEKTLWMYRSWLG